MLPDIEPRYSLPIGDAQRIFHGRGGTWPELQHVVVDWLPPIILVTLYAEVSDAFKQQLSLQLRTHYPTCESLIYQYRYLRDGPMETEFGEIPAEHIVEEAGLHYLMSLGNNRNTGLFLDMRNGRQWLRAHSMKKRVLNLFSYTCGFSVAAIDGGAEFVLNVDMSSPALAVGRRNHQLNQQATDKVRFEKLEIFRSFGRIKRAGPFDLLVCDPPTLQKGSVDIARDYPKIIRRLDSLMTAQADLLMCLNAPGLDSRFLIRAMQQDAPAFQFVEKIPLPDRFLEPEDGGLKALHFQRR